MSKNNKTGTLMEEWLLFRSWLALRRFSVTADICLYFGFRLEHDHRNARLTRMQAVLKRLTDYRKGICGLNNLQNKMDDTECDRGCTGVCKKAAIGEKPCRSKN